MENKPLTDSDILSYLSNHPDFFSRYPKNTFKETQFLKKKSSVKSFDPLKIEYLEKKLLKEQQLREQFVLNAKANQILNDKVLSIVLNFLRFETIDDLLICFEHIFPQLFEMEYTDIAFEYPQVPQDSYPIPPIFSPLEEGLTQHILNDEELIVTNQKIFLENFFEYIDNKIQSCTLIRLHVFSVEGLLILGSHQEDFFNNQQETKILYFFKEALEIICPKLLLAGNLSGKQS